MRETQKAVLSVSGHDHLQQHNEVRESAIDSWLHRLFELNDVVALVLPWFLFLWSPLPSVALSYSCTV